MHPRPSGIVSLLTDFGHRDPYVGILKGAVLRHAPKAVLVDLCHEVAPQAVDVAAFLLATAIARFPAGTVHIAVVDPGVGTARALLACCAHGGYWLAPDNGLLSQVLAAEPDAEVRVIDFEHLGIVPESRTFHGRDVLAPVGAFLAAGRYSFSALGRRATAMTLPTDKKPRVVHVDGYGNLITNVPAVTAAGARAVRIGGQQILLRGTYAEASPGQALGLIGSFGFVEVAVNGGDAAKVLGLGRGAAVEVLFA